MLKNFRKDFLWGTATSAYQIEGAFDEEGRTFSIWDTFCRQPGKIFDSHNGDSACQHYHLWQEDLKLLKDLGVNSYRFSISWPRIFPTASNRVNQKGIDFYSRLIDKLLEYEIAPFITLYHWDLPQYIQDNGGWASRQTSELFRDYAYTIIKQFSDRVKNWTTLNEPSVAAYAGHFWGVHAPGFHSPKLTLAAIHHLLLAHGMALEAIRPDFDVNLGITLNLSPVFPSDPHSSADQEAARLHDIYLYRAFLDALFYQKYPEELDMQACVQPGDLDLIGLPMDYSGINYYTATRVSYDANVPLTKSRSLPFGPSAYSDMWEFYPQGLSQVIERIWQHYSHLPIYILENGTSFSDIEKDPGRIQYLEAHIKEISHCLKKGIDIKGYFVWSLLDNFEWEQGYSKRFGLIHMDYETMERTPKASSRWYTSLIERWRKLNE